MLVQQQPMTERWQSWYSVRVHLGVVLCYALLSGVLFAPLLPHFFEYLPAGGDHWLFYWDLWWVKRAIIDLRTTPFYTTYVNFPQGTYLYFHTLSVLNGVLAIPLQMLGMNLIGAYNTLVVVGYIGSAYTMFLLADHIVKQKSAAFVAGLIFAFSPVHFARVYGQLNLITIQWLPLYILWMLKAVEEDLRPRSWWRYVLLAAAMLAFSALTEWTLAALLMIFTCLFGGYLLWLRRMNWRGVIRGPILRLSCIAAAFALMTAPVLLAMLREARANPNLKLDPFESIIYSADAIGFVTPPEFHLLVGSWSHAIAQHFSGNPTEHTTYLGISVLALAACAFMNASRRYQVGSVPGVAEQTATRGFWLAIAVVFGLLALGPRLHILGRTVFTVFRLTIPMPYAVLYYFPFFAIMRTPARFVFMVMLALAILAAFGTRALIQRISASVGSVAIPRWSQTGLAAAISLAIIVEFLPAISTMPPIVPPIYAQLIDDPDVSHAVLELPLRPVSHYYIAQTYYNKPMVGGYLARPVENPLIDANPALQTLALRSSQPVGTEADLRATSIRYVIVNWWLLSEQERLSMEAAVRTVFGRAPDRVMIDDASDRPAISLFVIKQDS